MKCLSKPKTWGQPYLNHQNLHNSWKSWQQKLGLPSHINHCSLWDLLPKHTLKHLRIKTSSLQCENCDAWVPQKEALGSLRKLSTSSSCMPRKHFKTVNLRKSILILLLVINICMFSSIWMTIFTGFMNQLFKLLKNLHVTTAFFSALGRLGNLHALHQITNGYLWPVPRHASSN